MISLAQRLTGLFLEYHKGVVVSVTKERGTPPRKYKPMQVGYARRLFQGIQLQGLTLLDQATKILSGLIVCHALPNTNHRTSIFLVQAFLEANGVTFPYYRGRRGYVRRFYLDTNPYIRDSKFILTLKVRQEDYALRYQQGKRLMHLKGGGRRTIRAEDLGQSNRQYNAKHREVTKLWLERMLGNQSIRYLRAPADSLNKLIALAES